MTNSTIKSSRNSFQLQQIVGRKNEFLCYQNWLQSNFKPMEAKIFITCQKNSDFKSLIASKPVYVATVKHLPQEILDDLQSMHKDFIWDGRQAKIKYCTFIGDYIDGGLKDGDLVSKVTLLKFIWIRKMIDTKNFHSWVAVADNILRNVGGVNVFQSNLLVAPSRPNSFKRIPVLYNKLIDVWKTFSGGVLKDVEFIVSQSLWNNKFITSKNNTLYSEELYCK